MRILFKTPHQVFFRRCFFVKEFEVCQEKNVLRVQHGLFGRKKTVIPLTGTILRFFARKGEKILQ